MGFWKRSGPMGSESTTEIRDGFGIAGVCGDREDHGDKRCGIEALGHRNESNKCRDGLFGEEMKLQIESVSGDKHTAIGRDEL